MQYRSPCAKERYMPGALQPNWMSKPCQRNKMALVVSQICSIDLGRRAHTTEFEEVIHSAWNESSIASRDEICVCRECSINVGIARIVAAHTYVLGTIRLHPVVGGHAVEDAYAVPLTRSTRIRNEACIFHCFIRCHESDPLSTAAVLC